MDKIKIAKQLIKIANLLLAEEQIDDSQFFIDNIVNKNLKGFTSETTKNNEIKFIYDKDESEGSYIIFGEGNHKWGYSVFVEQEEIKSVDKNDCKTAWDDLENHLDTYTRSFDTFLNKK